MERTSIPMMEYKDFSLAVHKLGSSSGKPFKATMELTYGCNLRCVHCYTDCYNQPNFVKNRELPYEEIVRILDQLCEEGILWLCLTGGEIFMRRDFLEIYRYARGKGFFITLFTNATLFTEETVRYLAEHPPFSIETSCHGATETTFDRVTRVPGSFKRFVEGLQLLRAYGLPVKVKTKAMTLNRHELDQVKALVEGLGLTFKVSTDIYPALNGDVEPTRYRLAPDEIVRLEFSKGDGDEEDPACAAAEDGGLGRPPDDRLFRCGCGTIHVHINAWGKLGTCTWVGEPRADLSKKAVADGIAEVFPQLRAAAYQTDTPCRGCQVHRFCDKMPATAGPENGDPEQPVAHFCETAFKRAARLSGSTR